MFLPIFFVKVRGKPLPEVTKNPTHNRLGRSAEGLPLARACPREASFVLPAACEDSGEASLLTAAPPPERSVTTGLTVPGCNAQHGECNRGLDGGRAPQRRDAGRRRPGEGRLLNAAQTAGSISSRESNEEDCGRGGSKRSACSGGSWAMAM